jgi:hypothetical protein
LSCALSLFNKSLRSQNFSRNIFEIILSVSDYRLAFYGGGEFN